MEKLAFKIKITVLWLFYAVAMAAAMVLAFMEPGVIEEIMAGEMGGMALSTAVTAFFALFWLIPLIMAFLTLILTGSAIRWANIVLGIIFAVFDLVDVIGHLSRGEIGGHMLMAVSLIVVPAVIAWYAWKWPVQEA